MKRYCTTITQNLKNAFDKNGVSLFPGVELYDSKDMALKMAHPLDKFYMWFDFDDWKSITIVNSEDALKKGLKFIKFEPIDWTEFTLGTQVEVIRESACDNLQCDRGMEQKFYKGKYMERRELRDELKAHLLDDEVSRCILTARDVSNVIECLDNIIAKRNREDEKRNG